MYLDLQRLLAHHGHLLERFPSLKVSLVSTFSNPHNLAIATARTCYSSRGVISPEDMARDEKALSLRDKIAASTMEAGHLTTRQHAHFVFAIEGVSRNLIWQFLHAHPYYNSEQVSQRYVAITGNEWYSLPDTLAGEKIALYHQNAIDAYQKITAILEKQVEEVYFSIFRARKNCREKYEKEVHKKAMEVARYVMPLSTSAYLYHTVSALTIYRYVRMMFHTGLDEAAALVLKMLVELNRVDPDLVKEIPMPLEPEKRHFDLREAHRANHNFDNALGLKSAVLVDSTPDPESILREAGCAASGVGDLSSFDFSEILDPEKNDPLGDMLYPVTLSPDSRLLNLIRFTFRKKLSHTADSQEQRHRTLPGTRPDLARQLSLEPDYITPALIAQNPEAKKIYDDHMLQSWEVFYSLHQRGVSVSELTYLLPNAFPVRFFETGDYLNFLHKWKSRLCYTAQEEIFHSTLEEVKQVIEKHPVFAPYIGPPCALRKTRKPRCPEGDRYCGVKVWKLPLDEYKRLI